MLQPVEPGTPGLRDDIVATCPGAYLGRSRAQYYLVVEGYPTHHWSRRKVDFATALERANKVLEKINHMNDSVPSWIYAVRAALLTNRTEEWIYRFYCRECAIKRFKVKEIARLATFKIAIAQSNNDQNVLAWVPASPANGVPTLIEALEPARMLPIYKYVPLHEHDQRLHGLFCVDCGEWLCYCLTCQFASPDYENDREKLREMREAHYTIVYAQQRESGDYILKARECDPDGNTIKEWWPTGYSHGIWTQETYPELERLIEDINSHYAAQM